MCNRNNSYECVLERVWEILKLPTTVNNIVKHLIYMYIYAENQFLIMSRQALM